MAQKRTLCFIHAAKVAGTAIRMAMIAGGMEGRFHWFNEPSMPKHWSELTPEEVSHFDAIGGHLTKNEIDAKVLGRKLYFFLAREPAARAVSLFEYIAHGATDEQPLRPVFREKGLRWAIEHSSHFRRLALNGLCRCLAPEATFEAALEAMQDGQWIIGLHDHVDLVWRRATRAMGWPHMPLPRVNVGRPGYFEDYVTPEIVEQLNVLNAEDIKLVDYIRSQTTGLRGRINAFRFWKEELLAATPPLTSSQVPTTRHS